jgi:DNA-binding winged helix-turn-helix (wHTH) protein
VRADTIGRPVSAYRFSDFLVSPKRRLLVRNGRELPLIPRYFDLLVFLIERRHEAVHRRDILDRVWTDVIVSDSALSQAIRTIRRTLDDDSREPRFIRTVSRHGYQFVFPDVAEVDDNGIDLPPAPAAEETAHAAQAPADAFEPLLARLTQPASGAADVEDQREAAELLHALGTDEALRRLGTRPGHARARALLRDTRWDAPGPHPVPLVGAPEPLRVARELVALRIRRAARLVARRLAGAAIGGGVAGAIAGAAGGLLLALVPDGRAPLPLAAVLALIGAAGGAAGGAGVGAGLGVAEAVARSARPLALIAGGAAGGSLVGGIVQWLGGWTLAALFGLNVAIGGGLEGLAIGAAAGLGYALATRGTEGGLAAPRGRRRLQTAIIMAALCGLAAVALTSFDRPMVGGTIHLIGRAAAGSQVTLAPLGRLVGETDFGPVSRTLIGFGEAAVFGLGLALGLTSRRSHRLLTSR